jgi:Barstar, RNAse (barnase) inhibitor
MKKVAFDFERIGILSDFYKMAQSQLELPSHFGNNLDALWDCITGDIALPIEVKFINMSMNQLETFDRLIQLFEEAAEQLGDDFSFEYYLKAVG